jgi:predicted lipoprotein with Yx(FWY)xxD motif
MIMAIGIATVGLVVLAGCGSSDSGGGYGGSDTSATEASGGAADGGGATSGSGSTVAVADGHLVGPDGRSLYLFESDQGTTSACTGSCAATWPALAAASPSAGDGIDASKLETASGQVADQVVYNGHLLYTFSGDKEPGDTNGVGIPDWYLVDASGSAIEG